MYVAGGFYRVTEIQTGFQVFLYYLLTVRLFIEWLFSEFELTMPQFYFVSLSDLHAEEEKKGVDRGLAEQYAKTS